MIDIKLIRENPELVKQNIKKKFQDEKIHLIDKVRKLDAEWRKIKYEEDKLRSGRNKISNEINLAMKAKKNSSKLIKQAKEKSMSLEPLADYINFFRYGCPPHGGGGVGPGRLIMMMLDLPNVREATYLPRDVKRLNP